MSATAELGRNENKMLHEQLMRD